ncbi:hypothetical protein A7982_12292 [Minicystis rosea]|nr:hypothetical protein A7982_12292 [Minicystis rosea]
MIANEHGRAPGGDRVGPASGAERKVSLACGGLAADEHAWAARTGDRRRTVGRAEMEVSLASSGLCHDLSSVRVTVVGVPEVLGIQAVHDAVHFPPLLRGYGTPLLVSRGDLFAYDRYAKLEAVAVLFPLDEPPLALGHALPRNVLLDPVHYEDLLLGHFIIPVNIFRRIHAPRLSVRAAAAHGSSHQHHRHHPQPNELPHLPSFTGS